MDKIGVIGGTLGLFTGVSMISILDFIQYIYKIIKRYKQDNHNDNCEKCEDKRVYDKERLNWLENSHYNLHEKFNHQQKMLDQQAQEIKTLRKVCKHLI